MTSEFGIGNRIMIHANEEEQQDELFQKIDGATGEVTEIYEVEYQPGVKRVEVTLDKPVEVNGETMQVIDGLYMDNLEHIVNRKKEEPPTSLPESRRAFSSFLAFNEALEEPQWYYGVADCNGLESFVHEPFSQDWQDSDQLFDLGLTPADSSEDPEKRKYNKNLGMMKLRAQANIQRHPVIFRVKLRPTDGAAVRNMYEDQDYEEALKYMKDNALAVQLARGIGTNPERTWNRIPDPSLDPMNN